MPKPSDTAKNGSYCLELAAAQTVKVRKPLDLNAIRAGPSWHGS
jgi:hypothetical protein